MSLPQKGDEEAEEDKEEDKTGGDSQGDEDDESEGEVACRSDTVSIYRNGAHRLGTYA